MKYFKKMINNNVALVEDNLGKESIVIGKGCGFQKKEGDIINSADIEKEYSKLETNNINLVDYFKDINYKVLLVCDEVKLLISDYYSLEYTDFMYLSLIDHINGSVYRINSNINVENEISNEDLSFYSTEVELANKTKDLIEKELQINFNDNELSFLILHFIGILYDLKYTTINKKIVSISNEILNIICSSTGKDFEDFSIERLKIHLKFFLIRQFNKNIKELKTDADDDLYIFLKEKYPNAEKILFEIIDHLEANYNLNVSLNEKLYLLIHIIKIIK